MSTKTDRICQARIDAVNRMADVGKLALYHAAKQIIANKRKAADDWERLMRRLAEEDRLARKEAEERRQAKIHKKPKRITIKPTIIEEVTT